MCKTPRIVLVLAALAAGGACDSRQQANDARSGGLAAEAAGPGASGTVSPEQARAAQLLSLSGGGGIDQRTGYAGALECSSSLALLMQTLESSPLIDQAQADALRRAGDVFRDRARAAGVAEGRSPQDIDADLTKVMDNAADDPAKSSRTAVACIRQLSGEVR